MFLATPAASDVDRMVSLVEAGNIVLYDGKPTGNIRTAIIRAMCRKSGSVSDRAYDSLSLSAWTKYAPPEECRDGFPETAWTCVVRNDLVPSATFIDLLKDAKVMAFFGCHKYTRTAWEFVGKLIRDATRVRPEIRLHFAGSACPNDGNADFEESCKAVAKRELRVVHQWGAFEAD